MLRLIALSIVAFTTATSTANATTLRLPHKPYSQMTKEQKVSYLKRQLRHDRNLIHFFKSHPEIRTTEAHSAVKFAHTSLRIAGRNLQRLTAYVAAPSARTLAGSDMGAWLCIHRYEGAWNDPNPPYWGGLQMDLGFQRTYGGEFMRRWGTADHWPVWAQITAARRARDGYNGYGARGYGPWPNTARLCGLL